MSILGRSLRWTRARVSSRSLKSSFPLKVTFCGSRDGDLGSRATGEFSRCAPPPLLYDLTFASIQSSPADFRHFSTPVTLFACVVTPSTQEELIKLGFANPFMALPKDAAHGSFENPTFPFTAESVAELNSKKVQMNGQPLTFSIVEGDAVRTHYLARANFAAKRALEEAKSKGTSNARSGGGRGGRGGRGGGRGGRGGQNGGGGGRGGRKDGGNGKMDVDAKKEEVKEEAKPRVSPQPYPPFPLLSHSQRTDPLSRSSPSRQAIDKDAPAGEGIRGRTSAPKIASTDE